MPIFSIEGRLGIFKGRSNIFTDKYDILILPGTLFICNGLLAEHRELGPLSGLTSARDKFSHPIGAKIAHEMNIKIA